MEELDRIAELQLRLETAHRYIRHYADLSLKYKERMKRLEKALGKIASTREGESLTWPEIDDIIRDALAEQPKEAQ